MDSSTQVGCLVEADQCSLGFSSSNALDQQLQTTSTLESSFAVSINGTAANGTCAGNFTYPISRKVYLNTLYRFDQVNGQELELAKCFSGTGMTSAGFNSLLHNGGLVPLATGPVCQDFSQENCSLGLPPSDACLFNPPGIPQNH